MAWAQAGARRRLAAVLQVQQRHGHPVRHAVEERDPDAAAPAGAVAPVQRLQDRAVGVEPGPDIADRDPDTARGLRAPGHRRDPRFALDEEVVGLHPRHRGRSRRKPLMSQVMRRGCRSRSTFESKPARAAAPGARFCTKTSALGDDAVQQGVVARVLNVEDDGFLAAVEPDEPGALARHHVVVEAGRNRPPPARP